MVDLESFGGSSREGGASICQIGAVRWNLKTGKVRDRFLVNALPDFDQTPPTYDTVRWWMHQSDAARRSLFDPEPVEIIAALKSFAAWYRNGPSDGVWSHATFDVPALQSLFKLYDIACPWSYKAAKDIRTSNWWLLKLGGDVGRQEPTLKHNALADAEAQAENITRVYKYFRSLGVVEQEGGPSPEPF